MPVLPRLIASGSDLTAKTGSCVPAYTSNIREHSSDCRGESSEHDPAKHLLKRGGHAYLRSRCGELSVVDLALIRFSMLRKLTLGLRDV